MPADSSVMGLLALFITLSIACFALDLITFFTFLAEPYHQLCRSFDPISIYRHAYSALVCGSDLPKSEFRQALQATSLLHLAIVSGSHLLLLEAMIEKALKQSKYKNPFILIVLLTYSLLTGWQAPAVRAVVGRLLCMASEKKHLHWSELRLVWLSGWFTWALFPAWASSFSLLLSWGAALGLALSSHLSTSRFSQQWKTHLFVYLILLPLLLPLSPPHPLSVLCNWLIGPLLGVILFPMSLVVFVFPWLTPVGDFFWLICQETVVWTSRWTPLVAWRVDTPIHWLWVYLIFLHSLLMVSEISQRRHQQSPHA